MSTSLAQALADGPVVMDGGLATQLEARGHVLDTSLWSARMLVDSPDEIAAAHRDFFDVGARVTISASYQASFEGFATLGFDADAAAGLMRSSVAIAARARDQAVAADSVPRWVAASVGPYGAALADGSEYRGDYAVGVADLRRWHRPRLDVLIGTEPDVLAVETIPCAAEVEAVLAEIDGSGIPAWLALTCVADGDRVTTRAGESAADVFAMAADVDEVIAVGVNCCDAADAGRMTQVAVRAAGKPGVVYPNRGEGWDTSAKQWMGPGTFRPAQVAQWLSIGSRLVGGCCRMSPADISAIKDVVDAVDAS